MEELNNNQIEENILDKDVMIKVDHVTMRFNLSKEKVDNLKEFVIRKLKGTLKTKKFVALNDICFEVKKGERLAILGFNGAGKSTLLKTIVGVYKPSEGEVYKQGVIAPLLELGAGFDPNYSGRENIFLYGSILGYPREYIASKIDEIIDFSELGHFIEVPVKNYSSGMRARLGFSIATAVDPDVLILDEVLSVGDAKFKKKSLAKVRSMFDNGVTVLFVSHNIDQVKAICNKAILLEHGTIIASGDVNDVAAIYEEKTAKPKAKGAKSVVVPLTKEEKKVEKKENEQAQKTFENFKNYEDGVVKRIAELDDPEYRFELYTGIYANFDDEKITKDEFEDEVEKLLSADLKDPNSPYPPKISRFQERLNKIKQ